MTQPATSNSSKPSNTDTPHTTLREGWTSDYGTSYLHEEAGQRSWDRWRRIQSDFVDDPQRAVSDAHHLVSTLMDSIVDGFRARRDTLESRWATGEDISTEELRQCLQSYRDFFGRLLPNAEAHAPPARARE